MVLQSAPKARLVLPRTREYTSCAPDASLGTSAFGALHVSSRELGGKTGFADVYELSVRRVR